MTSGCVTRATYGTSYTIPANTISFRDDSTGERMGIMFPAALTVHFTVKCTFTGRTVIDEYGQVGLIQSALVNQDIAAFDVRLMLHAKELCK